MFEIVKKIFYFTPDILYEFQLFLMKTTGRWQLLAHRFINQYYLGEEISPLPHT